MNLLLLKNSQVLGEIMTRKQRPRRRVRNIRRWRRLKSYNFRCWPEVFSRWVCWEELSSGFERADGSRPHKDKSLYRCMGGSGGCTQVLLRNIFVCLVSRREH